MIKKCRNCGNEFETTTRSHFCSDKCRHEKRNNDKFSDGSDYVVCKECGDKAKQITQHIRKIHHMTVDEYCVKHSCTVHDLSCESLHRALSTNIQKACVEGRCGWQKGGDNPSHSEEVKNGRRSPFSMNYHGYDGMTDEEKRNMVLKLAKEVAETRDKNGNSTTTLEYYLKRGYTEEEAVDMLRNRQTTFTLEKCQKKYGEIEGERIYRERQERWQNTINSKSPEEIDRINRAKFGDGRGYSRISQELFDKIVEKIGSEYKEIYYATRGDGDFNEYMVHTLDNKHRYFLDFFVKDNNSVIEFDGEYWHGEKRGNQARDREREENIRKLGLKVFRVDEVEYRKNPVRMVNECVKFIRGN